MPQGRMKHLLDCFGIRYDAIPLGERDAAGRLPTTSPSRPIQLVDPILLLIDTRPALVLLATGAEVNRAAVGRECDAVAALPATSHDFARIFPRVEPGTMPPLGNLCGVDVFADEHLARSTTVAFFNATRAELLSMRWDDLVRLVDPLIGPFALKRTAPREQFTHIA